MMSVIRDVLRPVMQFKRESARSKVDIGYIIIISAWLMLFIAVFISIAQADCAGMTKRFEGFKADIYKCPSGAYTIGYGFNLNEPEIRKLIPKDMWEGLEPMDRRTADRVFDELFERAKNDAIDVIGAESFELMNDDRQCVIQDMAYNIGKHKLSGFKKMISAIHNRDYVKASEEMKDSLWYKQTGRRARHHVKVMRGAL